MLGILWLIISELQEQPVISLVIGLFFLFAILLAIAAGTMLAYVAYQVSPNLKARKKDRPF